MRGYQIFVHPGITELISTEPLGCRYDAPHSDLWIQFLVDLLHYIWVFDDEFKGNYVAGSVYALICSCATDKGGFLGVYSVGLGDGIGRNKGSK